MRYPIRVAFDARHKKIFVIDFWGVTRWNWPDGKFEARIVRRNVDRNNSLMAVTPQGTLLLRLGGLLGEYDEDGKKLRDMREIDVDDASDLRVTSDGSLYLSYPHRGFAFKKYSLQGDLVLSRGLNIIHLSLSVVDRSYTAGEKVAVSAVITDRQKLYNQALTGLDEVKPTLWIRPYDQSSDWRRLAIETGADGKDYFTIPADLRARVF